MTNQPIFTNGENLDLLTHAYIDGKQTFLGEVRNFKSHKHLKPHLPNDISISWSSLPKGGELTAHFHPCDSMLIITSGSGESFGDTNSLIKEGDVVFIPKGNLHGFKTNASNGFKALSIQFQKTAIFQDEYNTETTYFDRFQIPEEDRQLKILQRDEINSIHETFIENNPISLGTLKKISSHPLLKNIFPKNFSCSWVNLKNSEELIAHRHPEASMIIITSGEGLFNGLTERPIKSEDIIFVPQNTIHGFKSNNKGFWGLSIQFTEESLYQNISRPKVDFLSDLDLLIERNESYSQKIKESNPLFSLNKSIFSDSLYRNRLLSSLQVISDYFQRLVLSRQALCLDDEYYNVFNEHLIEEIGHNVELKKDFQLIQKVYDDSILQAACSWFNHQNNLISNAERLVMVNMVMESVAHHFYNHFNDVFNGCNGGEHISEHAHIDEGHDKIGVHLLKDLTKKDYIKLYRIQRQSWDMMNLFLSRMHNIIIDESEINNCEFYKLSPNKIKNLFITLN